MLSRYMSPFTFTAVSVNDSDVVTVRSPLIHTCVVGVWPEATPESIVQMSASIRICKKVRHRIDWIGPT